MINILPSINAMILTTFLFISLFVGNAQLNGFYLFYLFLILIYALLSFYIKKKIFILFDFFVFFFVGMFFIQNLYSQEFLEYENYEYYFWPINTIMLYILFIFYISSLEKKVFIKVSFFVFLSFFYLLLLPSIVDLLTINIPRYSFIFGPNMYYRVLTILLIIVLYLYQKSEYKRKSIIILFLFLPYILGVLHTGSRGALFMVTIVSLYYMNTFMYFKNRTIFFIILCLVFVGSIVYLSTDITIESRLLLLDYKEGSSIGIRLSAYIYLFENFSDFLFSFGMTQHEFQYLLGGEHFHYPHNLFLELVYYYGFLGIISIVLIHMVLLVILKNYQYLKQKDYSYIMYILLILLLSASFSGDFSDNYPFLSLLFILSRAIYDKRIINK